MSRTTRTPSPLDLLVEQKEKEREGETILIQNLYNSLDYMRRQLKKYFTNTEEENGAYTRWAKELCADSLSPIGKGDWKIFFEEFKVIQDSFLSLSRIGHLFLYDISLGEFWPSLREPAGYFDRDKWRPHDYRKPAPPATEQELDDHQYGTSADAYILDYYDGFRDKDDIQTCIQVYSRALSQQIENALVFLYDLLHA